MTPNQNVLFSWQYDDSKNRSPLWYMIALACAIGIIVWGFLTAQYGMSIVVMLVVGFFYYLENNSEDEVNVQITELGISIQNNFYDYARILGYSLVYDGNQAVFLRLNMKKQSISFINLRLDNTIAVQLRPILSQYLEENTKQDITLLEKITHLLKL